MNSGSVNVRPLAFASCAGVAGVIVMIPAIATGINAMNPAIGPATPMSKTARRVGIGDIILINAPNVPAGPIIGGVGKKNGKVASTL